jgi:hypothetical protein
LLEIYTHHQRALRLMREFQPLEGVTKVEKPTPNNGRQQSLFFVVSNE